jgi:ATP-binding protein involved in chromosome partitioning
MLGVETPPNQNGQKIKPARSFNISFMSMGFMLQTEGQAVIWRGPMLHGVIQQFLTQIDWGELDYLVIDLPPGTGDVQLSLTQLIPLTAAVMVTTPQQVSLSDARKGAGMFKQLKVPIAGVVENMASYVCSHCHETTPLFPGKGGEELAEEFKVAFLGRVPFDPEVGIGGDTSKPIVHSHPESAVAHAFLDITGKLAQELAKIAYKKSQESGELGQIRL